MTIQAPTINEAYQGYLGHLLQHHHLLEAGQEESDEIELIEDKMTNLWYTLDDVQRQSISGLEADLVWILRDGLPAPRARKPEEVTLEDWQTLNAVVKSRDWHSILHQLRVCGSRIPPYALALSRAEAWDELDHPEIATLFHDFAQKLGGSVAAILMESLAHECAPAAT